MSATKILWGQLFLVSIVVLAFVWTATEWTAWRLAYQPQLGPAWFMVETASTGNLPAADSADSMMASAPS